MLNFLIYTNLHIEKPINNNGNAVSMSILHENVIELSFVYKSIQWWLFAAVVVRLNAYLNASFKLNGFKK
jgi:hypothetical protein